MPVQVSMWMVLPVQVSLWTVLPAQVSMWTVLPVQVSLWTVLPAQVMVLQAMLQKPLQQPLLLRPKSLRKPPEPAFAKPQQ